LAVHDGFLPSGLKLKGEIKHMAKSTPKSKPKAKAQAKAKTKTKIAAKSSAKSPAKARAPAKSKAKSPVKASPKSAAKSGDKKPAKKKQKLLFSPGDYVVYPTHGVGQVTNVEIQEIAGHKLKLFVISFDQDRMTLRVPVTKASTAGLRKLSSRKMMDNALETLKGRARVKRTMWSRRAQEYEAKINSGDPLAIAEVVRDLHRKSGQPDQSFSERQIFESARDRLAMELAVIEEIDMEAATEKMENFLKAA
jgi:CarD family transcriptional regulator